MVVLLSEIFCPWHDQVEYMECDADTSALLPFIGIHRLCGAEDSDGGGPLAVFVEQGKIISVEKIP